MSERTALKLLGTMLAAVIVLHPQTGRAQSVDHRINFIVGFAPGGFADTIGRLIAARLGERTGALVIVQNMEGAGSVRAARRVAMSPPDGTTILVTTTSLAINETQVPDRGYTASAFEAIALPVTAPESLSANITSPMKTVADVVSEAKAGNVFMGSPGIGSGSHIAGEYFFKVLAKAPVKHIPFPGGAPALKGLLSNDVNILAATATGPARAVRNGEVIGIALAGGARSPVLPDVPTFAESGYPGFLAESWTGFFAPAGTPEPVLAKLNAEINAIVQEPETAKRIENAALQTMIRSRADTAKFFTSEITNWSTMVQAIGVPKH